MIAQRFGLGFPDRALSVISIMSSTGRQDLPQPTEEALYYLTAAPENRDDEDETVDLIVKGRLCFDGGAYRTDTEVHREAARRAYRRANRPDGVARQMAAVFSDPTRRDELAGLRPPALIIHGTDDSLLPLGHGVDTAEAIPGARMEVIEGMGHALPDTLAPLIAELITSHTRDSA
jgi:proline iminopeptidase